MKKLLFSLMAIIAIGFSSCLKKDNVGTSQVVSVPLFLEPETDTTAKDQAVSCLPKTLIPTPTAITVQGIPPTGPAGVPIIRINMEYFNHNPLSGVVKFQIRKANNNLVTIGPYGLPPTPFGEFTVDDPTFFVGDFPLRLVRVAASIPGCYKTNFYVPPVPIVITL